MTKKNDKRLCWNCEGNVSQHLTRCPYCGVDLNQPSSREKNASYNGFASPFQSAPTQEVPTPPYARLSKEVAAVDEMRQSTEKPQKEEENAKLKANKEIMSLLLLLPGVVFFLFGLMLMFFSKGGVLSLEWNQNVAYFYFLGATPLLYLGWRAFR